MISLIFAVLGAVTLIAYDFLNSRPDLASPILLQWLLVGGFASFSVVIVRLLSYVMIDVIFTRISHKQPSELLRLVVAFLLYSVAATAILRFILGADIAALITSTAILTAVIGFALQATLGNVFEGLSVQIHQPFQIGDYVEIRDFYGVVESLTWRAVMIRQEDDTIVAIPNNMLASGPIRVFTAGETIRASVHFPAPIDTPPRRVTNVVGEALAASTEIVTAHRPEVLVSEIAASDSAIIYEARFYLYPDHEIDRTSAHIRERIWYALARAGIPMPAGIEASVDNFKIALLQTNANVRRTQEDDLILLSSARLFQSVPLETVRSLLENSTRLIFAPGETIIVSGPSRFSLFVVMRGLVSVPLPPGAVEVEENTIYVESYWQPEVIERIRTQFAEFMGPMSGYLVRNAARQTSDPYHLYRILAADIPTEKEREAFIALGPPTPAREIEPGQFFGERGALLGDPFDNINVNAVSEVEILEIRAADLRKAIKSSPDLAPRLAQNLAAHLHEQHGRTVRASTVLNRIQYALGESLES